MLSTFIKLKYNNYVRKTKFFLINIKYRFKKFLYLFYGEKFFKKKIDMIGEKDPKRFEIIQDIIDFKKYNSYLEIGCDRNQSFSNIKIIFQKGGGGSG